jgi:Fe-S-cluster formation regulator IscX/YfhJ
MAVRAVRWNRRAPAPFCTGWRWINLLPYHSERFMTVQPPSADDTQPIRPRALQDKPAAAEGARWARPAANHAPFDDRPIEGAREIVPDADIPDDLPYYEREERRRFGCGMGTVLFGAAALLALTVVGLAAAAGWTLGTRESSTYATATQNAAISDQLARIPGDIASGSLVLLDTRIRYLATLTPGVPGISEVVMTATALYLTSQPTPTGTPTRTPTPSPSEAALPLAEATAEPTIGSEEGGYDLPAILVQAQAAYDTGRWADAAELAEAIYSLDPAFQPDTVRTLLANSLNQQALDYFNANQTAAGIALVGRIQALGLPLRDGLAYEAAVGTAWLNAQSNLGVSFSASIRALQEVIGYGQGRYYQQAVSALYDQYVRYGDALALDPNFGYCPAVQQYRNAINLTGGGSAVSKLQTAETLCAQATPTFDPALLGTPGFTTPAPIAPIGQPGG